MPNVYFKIFVFRPIFVLALLSSANWTIHWLLSFRNKTEPLNVYFSDLRAKDSCGGWVGRIFLVSFWKIPPGQFTRRMQSWACIC